MRATRGPLAGTGNLLATNLAVPGDPAESVRLANRGGRRRIDVRDANGQAFAVLAGMGFDAALLEHASTKLKAVIGAPAYVLSALRHLRDCRMHVQITLDNDPPLPRRTRTVVIGNVGQLHGGVCLLPEAEPDNGQLEVATLAPHTSQHWVALAWGVQRGVDGEERVDARWLVRAVLQRPGGVPRQTPFSHVGDRPEQDCPPNHSRVGSGELGDDLGSHRMSDDDGQGQPAGSDDAGYHAREIRDPCWAPRATSRPVRTGVTHCERGPRVLAPSPSAAALG